MRAGIGAATLVAMWAAVLPSAGQDAVPAAADQRARTFARTFVQAMARGDRGAVASMVQYPAVVLAGGFNIPVGDRAELVRMYDVAFTPELRCLVEQRAVRADTQGAMLADGRIRLEHVGGDLKITRISVPASAGVAPPSPSKPQRVSLRRSGKAQFAGRLHGDGADSYVLSAAKGDVLEARIERFPGRSAFVRIVHLGSGRNLERPGAPMPRTWTDTLTATGEYRIDVVRQAPYCEPSFTYLLTVMLR